MGSDGFQTQISFQGVKLQLDHIAGNCKLF